MHMLSQAIDIMGWQFSRQLKVLVRKHQWSKCCVKPAKGGGEGNGNEKEHSATRYWSGLTNSSQLIQSHTHTHMHAHSSGAFPHTVDMACNQPLEPVQTGVRWLFVVLISFIVVAALLAKREFLAHPGCPRTSDIAHNLWLGWLWKSGWVCQGLVNMSTGFISRQLFTAQIGQQLIPIKAISHCRNTY